MPSEEQISISKLRLDIAKERLSYADEILKIGDFKTVANRSYYAVFSAMRAVLALDGFDSKKHSGIIAEFRRLYLKTEILPKELSETIDSLVEVRQGSDYDDFYIISKDEVTLQLQNARRFVSETEKYLKGIYAEVVLIGEGKPICYSLFRIFKNQHRLSLLGQTVLFYAANGISIWFLTALSDNSCDCICSSEKSLSRSSSRRLSTCS